MNCFFGGKEESRIEDAESSGLNHHVNANMSLGSGGNLNLIVSLLYRDVTLNYFLLEQEVQTSGSETQKNSGNSPCTLQA
jgi:hypothetical protein